MLLTRVGPVEAVRLDDLARRGRAVWCNHGIEGLSLVALARLTLELGRELQDTSLSTSSLEDVCESLVAAMSQANMQPS